MFDECYNPPPSVASPVPVVIALEPSDLTSTPSLNSIDQDAPSPNNNPFFGVPILEPNSEESFSRDVIPTNAHSVDNVIGSPPRLVFTRHQLQNEALFCYFDAFLTSVEPNDYKEVLKEARWIEAMQEE
ncbi:hypothetical protein Tco_1419214 [Tanacetum coccineum]